MGDQTVNWGKEIVRDKIMAQSNYVERALFIIGDQDTGKSTQLRSMFRDWRFGRRGAIPNDRNIPNTYPLSNERWLYLRLTSPHESDENLGEFLDKCDENMQSWGSYVRRWNFAGALQVSASNKMQEEPEKVIDAFINRFKPERVRVAILSPNKLGIALDPKVIRSLTKELRALPGCETMAVDATSKRGNGLMYADFFDFT